jgi:hypothetical protein
MAGKFKSLVFFPSIFCSMLRDFQRQKQFLRRYIKPDLSNYFKGNDGSLDEQDYHKIMNYYGFGVPAIVGEGFCALRGKRMTERERIASTGQGVITGLYDDFFDKTGIANSQIREMMENPFTFTATSSLESIFIEYLKKIHKNAHDPVALNDAFDRVYKVQVESQLQLNREMDHKSLLKLTYDKGGFSLLFYRSVFENPIIEGERDAIYQVGGLMQMANDLFDVYEDSRNGISTLFTQSQEIKELRSIYLKQQDLTIAAITELAYPEANKRTYLRKLSLGLSRCQVCLDQLEKLENRRSVGFNPLAHERKELVCDMEKYGNLFLSFLYYLKTEI